MAQEFTASSSDIALAFGYALGIKNNSLGISESYVKGAKRLLLKDRGWAVLEQDGSKVLHESKWSGKPRYEEVQHKSCYLVDGSWRIELNIPFMNGLETDTGWRWSSDYPTALKNQTNNYWKTILNTLHEAEKWNLREVPLAPNVKIILVPLNGIYLGGYGFNGLKAGDLIQVVFKRHGVIVGSNFKPWSEFQDVSITGRGEFQTGGGWWGGGFGIKGALEGAAFASIMNAITTKTHIETFIRLSFKTGELNLYLTNITPGDIDLKLSFLRGALPNVQTNHLVTNVNTTDTATQLKNLAELLKEGLLSKEEFEQEKRKLLGN
jgi:Short C-terminal domain